LILNVGAVDDVLPALRGYDVAYRDKWLDLNQT
jgi:hypothetical protein